MDDRLLKINGNQVDIDEKTAIGINLQSYDVKDPSKKYINASNSFTIPPTSKNLAIFGNPGNPQSTSLQVYGINYCDYWVGNDHLIVNSKVRLQESGDRISCFIYEKADFWEQMKKDLWIDTMPEFLAWLASEKGLPISTSPATGTPKNFLQTYIDATSGVILPFYFGNLYDYTTVGQKVIEESQIVLSGLDPNTIWSIDYAVTSDYFSVAGNVLVPAAVGTAELIAETIVGDLNAKADYAEYYTAVQQGETLVYESLGGILDASFNVSITGQSITDVPNSTNLQTGLPAGSQPLEGFRFESVNAVVSADIQLKYTTATDSALGGHFCIFAKTLFEFIEYKYGVDFLTSGGGLVGNIWDDVVANKIFTPVRELDVYLDNGNNYFQLNSVEFSPLTDQRDKADKSFFDLISSFMQEFNIVKDEFPFNTLHTIRLARFDDIKTLAPVYEFSGKLTGQPKYKPFVDGYKQLNYIKFGEVYPEGDELINSKTLTCRNENLDAKGDLFEIDAYMPSILTGFNENVLNMKDKESFKTFTWMLSTETTNLSVAVNYWYMPDGSIGNLKAFGLIYNMQIAEIYDLNSEYNFLSEIIEYPIVYEVQKWLTISDIRNFLFFAQYYIRELNGSYFINKIKGFNPLSKQPTTLELIKTSNRTPISPPDLNYYVDGVVDPYTDGTGDEYY